jgi:DNA-binding FadR family transcriptional regulator
MPAAPRGVRFRPPRGDASEQVALEIRRYVVQHALLPGDRLGTEQQLAQEFGVSRPTLREGLRLLASSHLVRASRGPGGGIFVANTPNDGIGRNLSESIQTMLDTATVTLDELLDARVALEVPLAGLAARNATDETVRDLRAAIAAAEGLQPAEEGFRKADTRFHQIIGATAGSELLRAFTSWILEVLQPSLIDTIGEMMEAELILAQHRDILRAVRRHQPASAERAMHRHLDYVRGLVREWDPGS